MGRKTKYTHDHDDEIEKKYVDENMSLSALSKEYSIPVMTIKRRLIKRGVEIRGISTAMNLFHKAKGSNGASDVAERIQRTTGVVQFDNQDEQPPMTNDDEWIS